VRGGLFLGVFVVVFIVLCVEEMWMCSDGSSSVVIGVAGLGCHQYRELVLSKVRSVVIVLTDCPERHRTVN